MPRLFSRWDHLARDFRADPSIDWPYYGRAKQVTASGRAICRQCGQKILCGDLCWQTAYDFNGAGSYTAQTIYLHLDNCKPDVLVWRKED